MNVETQELAGKIAEKCKNNLNRGRASAVGIGLFALIVKEGKFLLRIRPLEENKSLIYEGDYAGKRELIGGGVDLIDFAPKGDYQGTIFNTLKKEIYEEAGLILQSLPNNFSLIPAWLTDEKEGQVDLAFVAVIDISRTVETEESIKMEEDKKIGFFSAEDILDENKIQFISPRMKYLAVKAIEQIQK